MFAVDCLWIPFISIKLTSTLDILLMILAPVILVYSTYISFQTLQTLPLWVHFWICLLLILTPVILVQFTYISFQFFQTVSLRARFWICSKQCKNLLCCRFRIFVKFLHCIKWIKFIVCFQRSHTPLLRENNQIWLLY